MNMDHGSSTSPCKMSMTFHARACEMILWPGWEAYTVGTFIVSAIAIGIMAFAYEALKFWRDYLYMKAAKAEKDAFLPKENESACCAAPPPRRSVYQKMFNWPHVVQTLLHAVQLTLSYILMLIVMLCNYYLCLAIILGAALGYFCFGWVRSSADSNECCH